ncbi:hypothetical protein [Thalassospira australica]|uniref:hypothetical protein n=1 Tax=Thalassospira australica TaxID=1528106 RepID=UPI00384FD2A6
MTISYSASIEDNIDEEDRTKINKNLLPEVCFGHPLYEEIKFGESEGEQVFSFYYWNGKFDAYCPSCNRETVYFVRDTVYARNCSGTHQIYKAKYFIVDFVCSRDHSHVASFFMLHDGEVLVKVGQFPSIADLHSGDLSKYRIVLDKESSSEFYKANGLSAHGVGVGAFVYLRRVLERMVSTRAENAISAGVVDRAQYEGARFAEKIKMLEGWLPDILVNNTKVYSILSKGVHELEEQECLKIFPGIRDLMLFILEEDLQNKQKASKLEAAQKALSKL